MVVQVILLYGLDRWVMSPCFGRTMGGSHHRVVYRLKGRKSRMRTYWTWVYHQLSEEMEEEGL